MARPTNASIFLRKVREAGGRIGNGALSRALGWPEERYWAVHQELIDTGLIERGRGQGGTVILVVPESVEQAEQSAAALPKAESVAVKEELVQASADAALEREEEPEVREIDLYKPALEQLRKNWTQRKQLLHGIYEITAAQGRRDTGGSWSRPDIVAVGLRKFEYIPDRVLEVYSFEIKAEYDVSASIPFAYVIDGLGLTA